ncbi:DNA-binding response regulator [Taibaiella sp. KBW10]|uniref:LuxR C-terminal-related transcriptional regulator n=1 Tax=Taibaiella sp. KBW10 TaxID=2153357 RepID=UPI000F5B1A36|nr:LuxR C-terminal-related transcriptional regulator [Taibaiella sp. KBW10]RQO29744.1 DNA-binding response regulator [Taibaiella sp. KBW10]
MKKIRFSIADADFYFKQMLISSILNDPKMMLTSNCNNGHELIRQIHLRQENIFIIDLFMPIMSGIEAIRYIRSADTTTPIIAYSPTYQEDMANILLQLPKVYYCQKSSNVIIDILMNMVLTPLKRYQDYRTVWEKQSLAAHTLVQQNPVKEQYDLSLLEIRMMKLCYEGLSNKNIGEILNLSARTIDTYIKRLTDRLGLKSKIDLIRFCVEHGYYNSSL